MSMRTALIWIKETGNLPTPWLVLKSPHTGGTTSVIGHEAKTLCHSIVFSGERWRPSLDTINPCFSLMSVEIVLTNNQHIVYTYYFEKVDAVDDTSGEKNQRKARLTDVASDDCYIVLHQILAVLESQEPYPPP